MEILNHIWQIKRIMRCYGNDIVGRIFNLLTKHRRTGQHWKGLDNQQTQTNKCHHLAERGLRRRSIRAADYGETCPEDDWCERLREPRKPNGHENEEFKN